MSWSIYKLGTKQAVKEAVQNNKGYGDASQHDAIQAALLKVIDTIPDGAIVDVQGSGHHEHSSNGAGSGNFTVSFKYQT